MPFQDYLKRKLLFHIDSITGDPYTVASVAADRGTQDLDIFHPAVFLAHKLEL